MARKNLIACLLNISEAREERRVRGVMMAAVAAIESRRRGSEVVGASVLNVFSDLEYNRTVLTIAGELDHVEEAVIAAACQAMKVIDIQQHTGGHPRLGAVDLIPFHPLTPGDASLIQCGSLAGRVASRLHGLIKRSSYFLYGYADDQRRTLPQRRREMGWFGVGGGGGGGKLFNPDIGHFHPDIGLTGIGASPYMTNFNITINTTCRETGRAVLSRIREKEGGFQGVSALSLPHGEGQEIACNVDLVHENDLASKASQDMEEVMPGYWRVRFAVLEAAVRSECFERGATVRQGSVIVGFTPEGALEKTLTALEQGRSCCITNFSKDQM